MVRNVVLLAMVLSPSWAADVEGRIVNKLTQARLAGVTVRIYRDNEQAAIGKSDAEGVFRIEGLADGDYRARFVHPDFQPPPYSHPSHQLLRLRGADSRVTLHAELLPLAQLAGRVLHPTGEPMAGVPVAMRRPWQQQWSQTTYTNDQGVFRFPNLESGAWILAAIPSFTFQGPASASKPKPIGAPDPDDEGHRQGWATTFFPGTDGLATAAPIVLRPGMASEGYDLRLQTVVLRKVSGVVLDGAGKPVPRAGVSLLDRAAKGSNSLAAVADAEGRFAFDKAHDGDWRISAQYKRDGVEYRGWSNVLVTRRDVTNASVTLQAPFRVPGNVERDMRAVKGVTAIYLIPEDGLGSSPAATFHQPDGKFTIPSVYPGHYRVLPAGYVPGHYVASIWYGDQDVTLQPIAIQHPPLPLRIVYRNGAARVTGKVEKGSGLSVLLVPQEEALRDADQHVREAVCNAEGQFTIDSLRPGTYYAFAFDRIEKQQLEDPEFVRKLVPSAVRVELKHNGEANIELRWQAWPEY